MFFELEPWELCCCEQTSKAEPRLAGTGDRGKALPEAGT